MSLSKFVKEILKEISQFPSEKSNNLNTDLQTIRDNESFVNRFKGSLLTQVSMRSFDLARTGCNSSETILTPTAVKTRGIRHVGTLSVTGDKRGCEAQPLVATINGRSVVILATMGNVIQAFDLITQKSLWRIGSDILGTPIKGNKNIDGWLINDNWGILSTPVIDLSTLLMYACVWSSPDASVANSSFKLVEIDLKVGKVTRTCSLESATYNPGPGFKLQYFNKAKRKQRASLTFVNGVVHIPFGTISETSATAQGWIVGVDVKSMTVARAFATTVTGSGGGIWQAGEGLVVDSIGDLIFETANGDSDPSKGDYSECVMKISSDTYKVLDWWSPWADEEREGGPSVDTDPVPTNYRYKDQWGDQDLGSCAPTLAEDYNTVIVGCKDGISFPVDWSNFGQTMPTDFANKAANYAKLRAPAIYSTFPGFGYDPMPQDAKKLNFYLNGFTHHQHAAMTRVGENFFLGGENERVKAYQIGADGNMTWMAEGAEFASSDMTMAPGGMPGWMTNASSNNGKNAVLWALMPYGDANMEITKGRLIAYDAQDFTDGTLKVLWDSQDWGWVFDFNKFNVPVPVNGYILLPTYDGTVWVLSLA